ncbi:MAG: rhodanese-related sulfurtransferase [Proteobacteria bacterium]|nr:MAG: rhodanese-related sulfurtransferase [Pseudomonadota bacterium]
MTQSHSQTAVITSENDQRPMTTLSFYRYVHLRNLNEMMESMREQWSSLGVLGRTYLAEEGINAQVTLPTENLELFRTAVHQIFPEIPFKIALEEKSEAFTKLTIKVRKKLVADGLTDSAFDVTQVGTHLTAREFNEAMAEEETIVVDLRNHYECEVGRFDNALLPVANTFRDALPEMLDTLKGQEDKKLLLYCTGGIRCEKASAWFKFHGFKDVNQLHGGIIDYARQIKEEGLPTLYRGKNFVFDKRLNEAITDDVLATCHQCDNAWDNHSNCRFEGCNRLFLQCPSCKEEFEGCCSKTCHEIMQKPKETRVALQQEWERKGGPKHYWSKTRLPKELVRAERPLDEPLPVP